MRHTFASLLVMAGVSETKIIRRSFLVGDTPLRQG